MRRNHKLKATETELTNALTSDFPIRGWQLSFLINPLPEEDKFRVYLSPPIFDEEGGIKKGVEQPASEPLLTAEIVITAKQVIAANVELMGRVIPMSPDSVEKQLLHINVPQMGLTLTMDPKKAPMVEVRQFLPEYKAFAEMTEKWVHQRVGHTSQRFVLGQLGKIRENYIRQVRQAIGTMSEKIKQSTPDYWGTMELVMLRKMEASVAKSISRGVIDFVTFNPHLPHEIMPQTGSQDIN